MSESEENPQNEAENEVKDEGNSLVLISSGKKLKKYTLKVEGRSFLLNCALEDDFPPNAQTALFDQQNRKYVVESTEKKGSKDFLLKLISDHDLSPSSITAPKDVESGDVEGQTDDDLTKLNLALEEKVKEISQLKQINEELKEKIESLNASMAVDQEKLSLEVKALKEQLSEVEGQEIVERNELESIKKKLNQAEEKEKAATKEISRLQERLKDLEKQEKDAKNELSVTQEKIEQIESNEAKLKEEISQLQAELSKEQTLKGKIQEDLKQSLNSEEQAKTAAEKAESKFKEDLQGTKSSYTTQIEEKEKAYAELKEELEKEKAKCIKLSQEISDLAKEQNNVLGQKESKIIELEKELAEEKNHLSDIAKQFAQYTAESVQDKEKVDEDKTKEIALLKEQLLQLKTKLADQKQMALGSEDKYSDLQGMLESEQQRTQDLSIQINTLSSQLDFRDKQISKLEQKILSGSNHDTMTSMMTDEDVDETKSELEDLFAPRAPDEQLYLSGAEENIMPFQQKVFRRKRRR
ncbi:MAG: hypothetical protein HQL32_07670 [Planctomycetes bacterium]|nr:hypothetical protein [Planctomycetota bacterium]